MVITKQIFLEEIVCGTCGITHAVPKEWVKNRRSEKGDIHCPNGCIRSWRESDADRLRKQLEEKERALTASKCETMRANQLLEQEIRARVEADKKMRRVHKGVCPCCNRFVKQLARHMKSKHPEWDDKKSIGDSKPHLP